MADQSEVVQSAAKWLADNWHTIERPIIPRLRAAYALTMLEAIDAMRMARGIVYPKKAPAPD
ncbi:hypothetical protein [Mesorhizobium sp.]|uniref:hypothetical protein n=1 Tax=Mesorhizobium sp. TaxID=1871066 RepID=UPI000FE4DFDF|nr:hypothetical protein [Mesorhizobium sp.]RWP30577.1 MAG: hypothetical protein EOR02_12580 [Mesorhizobium sp.]RWQ53690.1 MAG: hypothetical protein EOS82_08915 [Mesorhizobium sp.]